MPQKSTLYTTFERQGNITIITQMTKANRRCRAKKISKDEYVNLTTGEVCEYEEHSENRSQCLRSLLRTFAAIRGIVNANSTDPKKVKFITLTYAEAEDDPERLYKDFSAFWKRFKRWSKKEGLPRCEYLVVCEPNEPDPRFPKQRFHFHLLLFYEKKAPFINNDDLYEIWGLGFTKISKTNEVDNLGAYLSAYLSDIAVEADEGDEDTKVIDGKRKSVVKGGRLHLYPPGFNIYRCSRGVKRPTKTKMSEERAAEYMKDHSPTFTTKRTIRDEKSEFETTVFKSYFNERRERETKKRS